MSSSKWRSSSGRRSPSAHSAALRAAAGRAHDLDPAAAREAPNRRLYRGLESLRAYLTARREVLYSRFLSEWQRMEAGPLGDSLVEELSRSTLDGHGR